MDQKFNLLMGATCSRNTARSRSASLTMPLLVGLDGVEDVQVKGNYIGISEPANAMFAKLLSISDDLMWTYFTLLSFRSGAEIAALKAEVEAGRNRRMPR